MRTPEQIIQKRIEAEKSRIELVRHEFSTWLNKELYWKFQDKEGYAYIPKLERYNGQPLIPESEQLVFQECRENGWDIQHYGKGWLLLRNDLTSDQKQKIYDALLLAPVY